MWVAVAFTSETWIDSGVTDQSDIFLKVKCVLKYNNIIYYGFLYIYTVVVVVVFLSLICPCFFSCSICAVLFLTCTGFVPTSWTNSHFITKQISNKTSIKDVEELCELAWPVLLRAWMFTSAYNYDEFIWTDIEAVFVFCCRRHWVKSK